MTPPILTDDEIDQICAPLCQSNAKVRYLKRLGLVVQTKPNRRPLVSRAHFDEVMGASSNKGASNHGTAPAWSH